MVLPWNPIQWSFHGIQFNGPLIKPIPELLVQPNVVFDPMFMLKSPIFMKEHGNLVVVSYARKWQFNPFNIPKSQSQYIFYNHIRRGDS